MRRAAGVALMSVLGASLIGAPAAGAATPAYAPLDEPGPALSVPLAQLKASLVCEPSVRNATVEPVLLNPATGVTAAENYSWNWEPALDKLGVPWCAYTAPNATLNDIQVSGEYIVYAIRTMYALAHRKIAIMGHSQGGMSMRWALRFWPDTRAMVDDVIGFSGSNHGTTVESASMCSIGCPPADWQQIYESPFIDALNSFAETFPGISYTEIYTHTDEVVQPNSGANASAALHTGGGEITNVATQDVCPDDVYEHLGVGTVDPVAYALAVDALTHPGPANPARAPQSVCSQLYMPGVNPVDVNTYEQIFEAAPTLGSVAVGPAATATSGAPVLYSQPSLACYVFASCKPTVALRIAATPSRAVAGKLERVRFLVTVDMAGVVSPVPRAVVTIGRRRRVVTDEAGRASARIRFVAAGRLGLTARAREFKPGHASIKVARAHT